MENSAIAILYPLSSIFYHPSSILPGVCSMSFADVQDDLETEAGAPSPRRWRRRFKIAAILLIVLAIGLRIGMIFALPAVLSRVAAFYGFDIQCQRQSLAVMGGHLGLWGVE